MQRCSGRHMTRQGDGHMAIGRNKGLSIAEDSTHRRQSKSGQRMRGGRFYCKDAELWDRKSLQVPLRKAA